ncbi:hypothetical protein CDG60_12190 [Acinetobacter chinensis]|uniref:Tip attachment protein J domain-containing protein n=1 Tax=Acinetobacter chinensis TaxID=2004650 RepID=A0A3B7M0K3_9GAMM|nr:host specificity factor TipJ family phage tail protein [Acinetobacter chinensis]AXY57257.1 hypothetical protein CDG60_12190 [Acinetobacter chinensis]
MSRLRIYEDPLDASKINVIQSDNVLKSFLYCRAKHPQSRIYKGKPCPENDVTPICKMSALKLLDTDENDVFEVVCHAGEVATIIAVVSAVVSIGTAIWTYLAMPGAPEQINRSSNNELTNRVNKQRLNGRVADIYGRVKSIPDLIAPPILYYREDGIEVEDCLMCIGQGHYEIQDIKDGDTLGSTIAGFSSSVYAPGQSLTGVPQIRIGDEFTQPPCVGKKSSAITGQSLGQASESVIDTDLEGTLIPKYPNRIYSANGGLDTIFTVGEAVIIDAETIGVADALLSGNANIELDGTVTIATAQDIHEPQKFRKVQFNTMLIEDTINGFIDLAGVYSISSIVKTGAFDYEIKLSDQSTVNPNWLRMTEENSAAVSAVLTDNEMAIDLAGEYPSILAVTPTYIELEVPSALQPQWDKLQGQSITSADIDISKHKSDWQGWFYLNHSNIKQLIFNFYFPQGMYSVGTNGKVYAYNAVYSIQYQEVVNGLPAGAVESFTYADWRESTSSFGLSRKFDLPKAYAEGVRFRLKKEVDVYVRKKTQRVNDLKIKSVYACSLLHDYRDAEATLIRSQTVATDGALSVKERLWNCIATRKLYTYRSGQRSAERIATSNFADIVCALTTDPQVGNRSIETLDLENLYSTADEIDQYFGVPIGFNYTFDDAKISYEESLAIVAGAVFCDVRRESNRVYFVFERPQDFPVLLFNHRNKQPGSEKRTGKFGVSRDNDGIKLKWVNPAESWAESEISLPDDKITNAKNIEVRGVTSREHAHLLAHRAWNKLLHQRRSCQFSAYHEADLVTRNDLILVANDTRPMVLSSGSVIEQDGLYITLSQPCRLGAGVHYVHLNLPGRKVDSIQVTQGSHDRELLLARAPVAPLVLEYDGNLSCSQYIVTTDSDLKRDLFLITDKSSSNELTCINYSDAYYENDHDFVV